VRKLQDSAYFVTALTVILAAALTPAYGQTFSVLYNFGSKASDPYSPASSGVIAQGRDGNFYGTAPSGGANQRQWRSFQDHARRRGDGDLQL
jgi:hypothetical protein